MKLSRRTITALLVFSAVLVSSCTTLMVLNETDHDVRVVIRAPDANGVRASLLRANGLRTVSSQTGGFYYITVLPDRSYQQTLTDLKLRLQIALLDPTLPAQETQKIQQDVLTLNQKIKEAEEQAKKEQQMCSGTVLDYGSVDARIYTNSQDKVSLSCTVQNPEVVLPVSPE